MDKSNNGPFAYEIMGSGKNSKGRDKDQRDCAEFHKGDDQLIFALDHPYGNAMLKQFVTLTWEEAWAYSQKKKWFNECPRVGQAVWLF